ncbi:hypothetical protein Gogos_001374, partial [Gossypium gossypioides]|nr:hypothetical protein [Gossypium gossypioides]
IPLSKSSQEDIQVWRWEVTGVFTVRSAYKLLQESTTDLNDYLQTHTNNFFRKLWNLDLPSKIKITISGAGLPGFSTKEQLNSVEDSAVGYGYSGQVEINFFMKRLQRENTTIFFDAAFDSQHNRSASGLVVKEQEGKIVAAKSILHENVVSPFAAEAYAGYQATMLGIQLGYLNVDILGDSKTVATKCQSENCDRSEIGAIISDIQGLKGFFQKIRFIFIPRTGNIEAHRIARETLNKGNELYLKRETSRALCEEQKPTRLGYSEQRERR